MKRFVRQAPDVLVCHNPDPSPDMAEFAVKQEFKNEVDINQIIARMQRGIQPPPWMTAKTPRWGDFSNAPATFQEAFALVEEAKEAFLALPLEMRKELDHNPQNLDIAPRELYEKYGLLNKPAVDARAGTPDASDAPGTPTGRAAAKNQSKGAPGPSKLPSKEEE